MRLYGSIRASNFDLKNNTIRLISNQHYGIHITSRSPFFAAFYKTIRYHGFPKRRHNEYTLYRQN